MSKKLLSIGILLIIVAGIVGTLPVTPAAALTAGFVERAQERASNAAARQDTQLTNVIQSADTMIANRIASLQNLLTRVQNDSKLSSDDKTTLTNDINTTIQGLTTLKAKIDADTDATTARSDRKSIVTSYRVYVFLEPKERLLIIIDNLQQASSTVATLVGRVQSLLDTLKGQGKDITQAQTALNDISAQLTTINGILATDKTLVQNVTIATRDPQSVFTQVRKDVATVRSDFAKIRSDFASLREDIRIILPKATVTTKPTESTESAK